MLALFNKLLDWFKALFWKEEMELTLVGLQYSGKTTFVNMIALWDIGGQPRFRSMWERYCRGVLVLGNKRDIPGALDEKELIERMNLSAIQDREICCYSISCKEKDNIDITLQWLIQHSKSRRS
ncbi:hypothetical protein XELAEV_18002966mg [Xenopus laevis]|nr:hypothetical protein XELAEV_18002966mg [Xenopus laevis]